MPLVLEGWKETLLQAGDFHIVGEISSGQLLTEIVENRVHIVFASISLLAKTQKKGNLVQSIKEINSRIKVVLTVENDQELKQAQRARADEAILKPFRKNDLTNLFQGLSRDDKRLCNYYAKTLLEIGQEPENAKRNETLITDILRLIFQSSCQIYSDGNVGDFYRDNSHFQTSKNGDFWEILNTKHQVNFVFCWIQNVDGLDLPLMQTISGWSANNTGTFGIVVIRSEDIKSNFISAKLNPCNNNGKTLLIFTDKEIRSLLSYKAAGIDLESNL